MNFEEINKFAYQEQLQLRYSLFLINTLARITVTAIVLAVIAIDIMRYMKG